MQLVFGIQPATYDEYYNPLYGDRPDFFGDIRTRQAIAACLDRTAIQEAVYAGLGEQWSSFVSPAESTLAPEQAISYDPAVGAQLLEAVGWRDHDLNPETPLQAWYIGNIPANTLFSVTLPVDGSAVSQQIASIVQRSLGQCGIEVTPVTLPSAELYATSAEGRLFGRKFDLALMAWAPSPQLDCILYRSDQVPSEENGWIGTNIAGLAALAYDAACDDGSLALPSEKEAALGLAEEQYLDALPAVPLLSLPEVMIVKSEVCSALTALWPDGSAYEGCP
jgi:peptide/nickel transport system substrate-binding protein